MTDVTHTRRRAVARMMNAGRMLADGIPYPDFEQANRIVLDPADWYEFWSEKGSVYEELGEQALRQGHRISAGEWLWLASLSFHYAQFMLFDDADRRREGHRRKVELYKRAAPHLSPPAERIEIAFEGKTIPGYLRFPLHPSTRLRWPCVVLLGGLESTKEESYLFENLCLARGLATFAFDGPGQGEMWPGTKLERHFERYTTAVLDDLDRRHELDSDRLGVLGRSLGGHYALRSAAQDERLKACVAWGFFYDLSEFDSMHEHTQRGFAVLAGFDAVEEAKPTLKEIFDLGDVVADLRVPTLLINGRRDTIFSMSQMALVEQALINAPKDVVIEDEGDHCCHNMAHVVRPRIADWLADKLVDNGSAPPLTSRPKAEAAT